MDDWDVIEWADEDDDDMDHEFDSDEYDMDEYDDVPASRRHEAESVEIVPLLLQQLYTLRFAGGEFNEHEFKRVSARLLSHVTDDAIFSFYRESLENGQVRVDMHNGERDEVVEYTSLLYHLCNLGCDYETIETVHHELDAVVEEYEVDAAVRGNCDSATMDLLLLRSQFDKVFFIRVSIPEVSCVEFDFEMQDLAEQVRTATTIQELCLVHDEISDGDLNDLIIALSGLRQLTRLTIHGRLHKTRMAVPIPSLGQLIHLVHLDLTILKLGPSIAGPLSELVKTTTALTHLNLAFNDIGLEGMRLICDALRFNKSILTFTVDHLEPLDGMVDVLDHNSTILKVRAGDQEYQLRSWFQANFVGRRALFDAHCSKETFVDLLCSLRKESLNEWYERFSDHPHSPWGRRNDFTDFESVVYILLRTKPDVWST